jgi:hypothetical protein
MICSNAWQSPRLKKSPGSRIREPGLFRFRCDRAVVLGRCDNVKTLCAFPADRDGCPADLLVHEGGGYTCTDQAILLMMRCGAIMSISRNVEMGEFFEMYSMK